MSTVSPKSPVAQADAGLDPEQPHEPLERHPGDRPDPVARCPRAGPASGRPARPRATNGATVSLRAGRGERAQRNGRNRHLEPPLDLAERHLAPAVGAERLARPACRGRPARSFDRPGARRSPPRGRPGTRAGGRPGVSSQRPSTRGPELVARPRRPPSRRPGPGGPGGPRCRRSPARARAAPPARSRARAPDSGGSCRSPASPGSSTDRLSSTPGRARSAVRPLSRCRRPSVGRVEQHVVPVILARLLREQRVEHRRDDREVADVLDPAARRQAHLGRAQAGSTLEPAGHPAVRRAVADRRPELDPAARGDPPRRRSRARGPGPG